MTCTCWCVGNKHLPPAKEQTDEEVAKSIDLAIERKILTDTHMMTIVEAGVKYEDRVFLCGRKHRYKKLDGTFARITFEMKYVRANLGEFPTCSDCQVVMGASDKELLL